LFDPQTSDTGLQHERGVFIAPRHQAHGYGKEAIIALTDYAFQELKLASLRTMVDPENTRSLNNIVHNSGGVKYGEAESKYAHLDGGGKLRYLFHIYPENFYSAVEIKGNQKYLMQPHNITGGAPANDTTSNDNQAAGKTAKPVKPINPTGGPT
jgi:hypothetical protein